MSNVRFVGVVAGLVLAAGVAVAQGPDPRTPAGQLAACGGAPAWKSIGFLDFEVSVTGSTGVQGPFRYRWDRPDGFLRFTGPTPGGGKVEAAIDLGSRTGGAWEGAGQLTGKKLADTMTWALQRFAEDALWLTFPVDWGQRGVTVTVLPDTVDGGASYPTVDVNAPSGVWRTMLDPATGLVLRTALSRQGRPTSTATWEAWQKSGGVFFAHKHVLAETGETVVVNVIQAAGAVPPGTF